MNAASTAAKAMLQGERSDGSMIFAAVDPSARYCVARVGEMRFAALLTPFACESDGEAALRAAGADLVVPIDTGKAVRK